MPEENEVQNEEVTEKIAYCEEPLTKEEKAKIRGQGFRILNIRHRPKGKLPTGCKEFKKKKSEEKTDK